MVCTIMQSILNFRNLSSSSLDREIIIDGNYDDWSGQMQFLEKDKISVGLMNDAEYLYISLVTNDRQIRSQMMFMGFTIWLDPQGGNKKTFGIRFSYRNDRIRDAHARNAGRTKPGTNGGFFQSGHV